MSDNVSPVRLDPNIPTCRETGEQTITLADVGRRVMAIRGINWDWLTPSKDTIVVRVQINQPWGTQAVVASKSFALCFDPANIRLLPRDLETQK